MITFAKETTAQDEAAIEDFAGRIADMGFPGDTIVYRNAVDAALAMIALKTLPPAMEVGYALGPNRNYAIIGTKSYKDGKIVRDKVSQLRDMVAPAFGVTPEAPKPAAPAKPGKLNI